MSHALRNVMLYSNLPKERLLAFFITLFFSRVYTRRERQDEFQRLSLSLFERCWEAFYTFFFFFSCPPGQTAIPRTAFVYN